MDVLDEPLLPAVGGPVPRGIERGPKQFVDLQNDVTAADIVLAAREGFESVEHVKRYTAMGFGTDQGKLGNINGMAILAQALGQDDPADGHHDVPSQLHAGDVRRPGRAAISATSSSPIRKTALHAGT